MITRDDIYKRTLGWLLFPVTLSIAAVTHGQTEFTGNIQFTGMLMAPTCVLGFESEEQNISIGDISSRDIEHEQHNSLVIDIFECGRNAASETDTVTNTHLTQSNGQMLMVTFTGETLPEDHDLFVVEPRQSGLGLRLIDKHGFIIHPGQHSVIYPLEEGGNQLQYSTVLVPGKHHETTWRGKVESLVTFHIQYP